jgi:hypothetical protein
VAEGTELQKDQEALEQLRHRFALRLDAALDAHGFPVLRVTRARSLAAALAVDISVATTLMAGLHLPDYAQLLALCSLLRQQPGYFLDAQVLDLPPGTCVVKPIGIGEDLVLRLPTEVMRPDDAVAGLRYWRTTVRMGFGISAGEYLVVQAGNPRAPAEPKKLYLLYSDQAVDVVRCMDVASERAVFLTDTADAVPLIVPAGNRGRKQCELRKLVASIRCGPGLHVMA